MTLLTITRSVAAVVFAISSWLSAQAPEGPAARAPNKPGPDPKVLLGACLDAHRGGHALLPKNLYFRGDVTRRSAKGDVNEADIWQWYARATTPQGKVSEQMVTKMMAKGTEGASLRMFDGKRHFVVTKGQRIRVDGKASYKNDLANIKRDLALTRFLVRHFFAGSALRRDATFSYLGRVKLDGKDSHKITRTTPDKVTTIYYVNADPKQKPFLNGIEFPAAKDQPRRVHRFGHVFKFGKFHVPQEIKISDEDDAKSVVSIWITQLRVDEKTTPDWAVISRYPRKKG